VTGSIPAPTTFLPEVVVGPFTYTAKANYQYLFAHVSAPGDLSNIDPASGLPCATGPTPIEQLLRCDNNLAIRVIYPSFPPPSSDPIPPGSISKIHLPPGSCATAAGLRAKITASPLLNFCGMTRTLSRAIQLIQTTPRFPVTTSSGALDT